LKKYQGRDEFDTNNIVMEFIAQPNQYNQAIVTTGDIYELALMNVRGQPIFLLPESGSYSLARTAAIISKSSYNVMLGVGKLVSEGGTQLRQRTGAKLIVKFGSVRTKTQDQGFVRKDVSINLEGYDLPMPKYDGKITEINPIYTDPFGPATGHMIARDRPAPPVEFNINFEDTGNIDFPAYIILEIRDESGALVKTLQSQRQMVYPKKPNIFKFNWEDAPAEGKYSLDAKVYGDVYEGIQLPGKKGEFDLRWLYVLISLLLLVVALVMLMLVAYSSHVLHKDIFLFGGLAKRATEQMEGIRSYITDLYHFRGRKRK
jgi:hypothetical protein